MDVIARASAKFLIPAYFQLESRPFVLIGHSVGKSFLVACAKLETGGKSNRTDFVTTDY